MPATALPVLYSFRRCPYAMRARLALAASGEPYELREVLLRDKPAELLAASPKGTVPVLVTAEGSVIDQSLDIMLWALRRHDPLGWLPPDEAAWADTLALIATCDTAFKQQLDRYKYPERHGGAAEAEAARAQGAEFLHALDARLAHAPQLAGGHATLVDAAVMPFVRQFSKVEPAWFAAQRWPQLRSWLDGWTDSALLADVMQKQARWTPIRL